MTVASVRLWGKIIGAVSWDKARQLAHFEYSPAFSQSGIELSPLMMPLKQQIYSFPELAPNTFHGLPGMLADALPDRFGNALIDAWLAREGRAATGFNPVERLCYIGKRGMGALEFEPALGPFDGRSHSLEIEHLVQLAGEILAQRSQLNTSFESGARKKALLDILRVGTSAGGARAKAIIAWNAQTQEVRSGQVPAGEGFSYWLLKFDGVSGNRDKELDDPKGYGLIEYAYYLMAQAAGIEMMPSRLLREQDRAHFMTQRFDRTDKGQKIHMQSLCALAHYDFNQAGAYSYEQAQRVMRRLDLPMSAMEEQFRRTCFNLMARNQDDHVKNIAFLMDKSGRWFLSPAFDLTYSYNPKGLWTGSHQMTLNGKRDHFTTADIKAHARTIGLARSRALDICAQVQDALLSWADFAEQAGIDPGTASAIANTHRLQLSAR